MFPAAVMRQRSAGYIQVQDTTPSTAHTHLINTELYTLPARIQVQEDTAPTTVLYTLPINTKLYTLPACIQKPNSGMHNFVEVSRHNLESSQP
jgi:hypothetical protein